MDPALLEAIRAGAKLNKVQTVDKSIPLGVRKSEDQSKSGKTTPRGPPPAQFKIPPPPVSINQMQINNSQQPIRMPPPPIQIPQPPAQPIQVPLSASSIPPPPNIFAQPPQQVQQLLPPPPPSSNQPLTQSLPPPPPIQKVPQIQVPPAPVQQSQIQAPSVENAPVERKKPAVPPKPGSMKTQQFVKPKFRQISSQDLPIAEFQNKQVMRNECDHTCWVSFRMTSLLQDITQAIIDLSGQ
ncbi:WH2_domain [Hexamita inflata]|uniref:WH2 domain n=1 Tax=Hexamita inflata TaxID=28002 RepID=A0AA86NPP9_9EUKA|nr:WH2 domain [Hexamita inflata]